LCGKPIRLVFVNLSVSLRAFSCDASNSADADDAWEAVLFFFSFENMFANLMLNFDDLFILKSRKNSFNLFYNIIVISLFTECYKKVQEDFSYYSFIFFLIDTEIRLINIESRFVQNKTKWINEIIHKNSKLFKRSIISYQLILCDWIHLKAMF
jgi:hypothetical protein